MNSSRYNVLVIGGGIAGLVAASRAAELGGNVLLIDKGSAFPCEGNTAMTTGSYYTAGISWKSSPGDLFARAMDGEAAHPELAAAWADNCARALDWLQSARVEVDMPLDGEPRLEPRCPVSASPVYRAGAGINISTKLQAYFHGHRGTSMSGTRATKLIKKKGSVVGIEAVRGVKEKLKVYAGATVLATGGYQGSEELLRKYVGRHTDKCKMVGSRASTGDGLKMAVSVGAKTVNMRFIHGRMLCLTSVKDDRFWPYPTMATLFEDGIVVDKSGRRFCDEGWGDIPVANLVARWDSPRGASLVFGEDAWERSKGDTDSLVPPNPWLVEKQGAIYKADNLEELANKLGVDGEGLGETVEEFNAAARKRRLGELEVPRINNAPPLNPPFYGVRVVPGIVSTMGGPLISKRAKVLNNKGEPIPGLYAAGDLVGGLMGGGPRGYLGGISQACVTGLLAGENGYSYSMNVDN